MTSCGPVTLVKAPPVSLVGRGQASERGASQLQGPAQRKSEERTRATGFLFPLRWTLDASMTMVDGPKPSPAQPSPQISPRLQGSRDVLCVLLQGAGGSRC